MTELTDRMRAASKEARASDMHFPADVLDEALVAVEDYFRRLNRLEYAIARPASMPDMSGRERWTLIVSTTFPSLEAAENARRRVPALRGCPAVIVARIAPGSDWDEATRAELAKDA